MIFRKGDRLTTRYGNPVEIVDFDGQRIRVNYCGRPFWTTEASIISAMGEANRDEWLRSRSSLIRRIIEHVKDEYGFRRLTWLEWALAIGASIVLLTLMVLAGERVQ